MLVLLLALSAVPGGAEAQPGGAPSRAGNRAAATTAALRPVTLVYETEGNGPEPVRQVVRLSRDGRTWVLQETLVSGALRQTGERRFQADFSPVSQEEEVTVGGDKGKLEVRMSDGSMKGSIRAPAQLGGSRSVDVPIPSGTLLAGMDRWVLAAMSLAVGQRVTLSVFDPFAGIVRPVSLQVAGTERIVVPAGTFDAFRIEAGGGGRMWVRATPPHYLLREELPGHAAVTLRSIEHDGAP